VDGPSLMEFEQDEKNNLYKLWNRLSSGRYFPPPVKAVGSRNPGLAFGSLGSRPLLTGSRRRRWPC
jgi:retron-type reverse transcriptase